MVKVYPTSFLSVPTTLLHCYSRYHYYLSLYLDMSTRNWVHIMVIHIILFTKLVRLVNIIITMQYIALGILTWILIRVVIEVNHFPFFQVANQKQSFSIIIRIMTYNFHQFPRFNSGAQQRCWSFLENTRRIKPNSHFIERKWKNITY